MVARVLYGHLTELSAGTTQMVLKQTERSTEAGYGRRMNGLISSL